MSKADEPAFREIPGWPQYEVASDGTIRSWFIGGTRGQRRRFPHYKKPHIGKDGYARVTFHEKSKGRKTRVETMAIHRVVATVYLPTKDTSLDVAHLDGVKTNNRVSNLKWCTRKENEAHKIQHGTKPIGERNGQSKLCSRGIEAIKKLRNEHLWTQRKIADLFQISQSNVSAILLGKSWFHK